jgi:hypothetical protein
MLRIILEQIMNGKENSILQFVDSEKAFDSLARDVIWQVLEEYKVPKETVSMIKAHMKDLNVMRSTNKS